MKIVVLTIAALLSLSSFAGSIKKTIPQSVLDRVNVGNGAVYIQSYDVKTFDLAARMATVKKWNTESGCKSWSTEASLENALTKLNESGATELASILENLRLAGQLKAAIYNTAAPSYDVENCSFNYYEFYSNDGDLLIMDIDTNV